MIESESIVVATLLWLHGLLVGAWIGAHFMRKAYESLREDVRRIHEDYRA